MKKLNRYFPGYIVFVVWFFCAIAIYATNAQDDAGEARQFVPPAAPSEPVVDIDDNSLPPATPSDDCTESVHRRHDVEQVAASS